MAQPPPIIIPAELDDAGLSPAAFRILCHLIRRGAGQDSGAWGSVKNMAILCKMDLERVKISLKDLIESGWIERISRPGFTSIYRLLPQAEKPPRRKNHPGGISDHPPGGISDHPPGGISDHEGVTGRSQEKELTPQPPEGGESIAGLTSDPTPIPSASTDSVTHAKKEKGRAESEEAIRDVPTALGALHPLLLALHRDPRQGLTPQEEHDLLPLLRSPAGLLPSDITAIATAVQQRATFQRFEDIPNDSPLRSVRRKLGTLLADWPNQSAIARQVTGKTNSPARRDPNAPPPFPWEAVCWHLYEAEPVAWHLQTYRDRRRFADLWRTWSEEQRQTALHRYQHRLTTTPETELTAA